MRREQTLADRITGSALWRSVVRHGYPDTQRNQALIIAATSSSTSTLQDQALRDEGDLHLLSRRTLVLHVPCPDDTGVLLMFYYVPPPTRRIRT